MDIDDGLYTNGFSGMLMETQLFRAGIIGTIGMPAQCLGPVRNISGI
jgi:hypothetical protein